MTMRRNVARGVAIALSLVGLLGGARSEAQVTTGTIVGTVTDAQGAAVPGATVTITETGKGTSSTHTTDASGSFVAPFLIPGTYDVAVELAGFRKYTHRGVVLQVNQRARIDAKLEVGGLTESTEVIGLAPLTRTDSAELGQVIEERAVRELPLNGRNFATLVYLAPGVTAGQVGENLSGASTFNPRGASNFNALGSQANTNAWLVDGIDNNEFTFNTVIVQPTVESVREFKVLTGSFSAEFGRGAGVVSVSTKSGSNEWHGTAFEYLRNEKFDAKNFFALPTAKKAPLDRHQFGAALSGPIIKNKTFFFVDYAGIKEERGQVFVNTVPTEATRRGDFSDYRSANGNLIPIYDPLTTRPNPNGSGVIRDPFPGNIIPADRLDAGRPQRRLDLPPAEQRLGQLRQLHVDREPLGARPLLHRPRRPPRGRPRQLLRALRLREVLAGRAPGPGGLLPGNAPGRGGPLRPRSLRGGDPEHAPHHPRRGLQLDPPLRAERGQRASPRLRQDQPRDPAVGLRHPGRHQPRHPGHQRERVRHRPAQPQHPGRDRASRGGRPSCP